MPKTRKAWSIEEESYLRESYGKTPTKEIAKHVGHTEQAVRKRASIIGVSEQRLPLSQPIINNDTCLIPLHSRTRPNTYAIIDNDPDILAKVIKHRWFIKHEKRKLSLYAVACNKSKSKRLYMHSLILGTSQQIDHKDNYGLNNRKSNLRVCTTAQNNTNSRKRRGCSSKFRGVFFEKHTNKWRAKLGRQSLGRFSSEIEAAKAFDKAASKKYGEFAKLNF